MNQTMAEKLFACLSQLGERNFSAHQIHNKHGDHDHDHDHDDDHDEDSDSILIAKITAMVVLFCASGICGSIPFLLNRCFKWTERQESARSAWVVQCLLYFGGGVLLATTFLHLLPEIQSVVENMIECHVLPALTFPLAELLMCTGFFMMYLIEEALHLYIHRNRKKMGLNKGAGAAFERGHSVRNSFLGKGVRQPAEDEQSQHEALDVEQVGDKLEKNLSKDQECGNGDSRATRNGHTHSHLPIDEADGMLTSSLRGFFIVLALSLHELFEGMAIGLETNSAAAVWFLFGAVSAHKLVLAFCVGVELIVARTRLTLAIVYVTTFAIVSPIGIGIGILITIGASEDSAPTLPSAILQGLACGTLLYVVFFEILSKDHSGLRTYVALVFGFLIMFGLQQIGTGGEHGHSHGNCEGHNHDHSDENAEHRYLKQPTLEPRLQLLRQTSKSIANDFLK